MTVVFELLPWPHPDSTAASPMTGSESRWRIAKPVKWRQEGLEANHRRTGRRLEAPHIRLPQRSVSAACLAPEINASGAWLGLGTCLRWVYVLTLRLALALPA
jgi:hypothetical protein